MGGAAPPAPMLALFREAEELSPVSETPAAFLSLGDVADKAGGLREGKEGALVPDPGAGADTPVAPGAGAVFGAGV